MTTAAPTLDILIGRHVITVRAVKGSRKYRDESAFWYALKNALKDRKVRGAPTDLVKKIMSKDGHMVGGDYGPYYLRDRERRYCIWDANYAVRCIEQDLHDGGTVHLCIHLMEEAK